MTLTARRTRSVVAFGLGVHALAACDGSSSDASLSRGDAILPAESAPEVPANPGANASAPSMGAPSPAPEVEREATFQAPVVTGRYVWSANPESGRVAVIDADTFEVRSAQAGDRPTFVAGLEFPSGARRALVINTGAADASLLALTDAGISAEHVPLHEGADTWSISPDRRFAIAWTDRQKARTLEPTDGFQDITVLEVREAEPPRATRLTVGYRPSAFAFDATSRRAFGVTEDGVSIIELTAGNVRLSQLVPLPNLGRVQPDVSITSDGSRALARLEGSASLYDIDLASGGSREIVLDGPITDLDLSADGSRAVAVIRALPSPDATASGDAGADPAALNGADAGGAGAGARGGSPPSGAATAATRSEAVFIAVPAGLTDAAERRSLIVPGGGVGSVALSPDGSHAVLFSNALGSGRVTLVGPDLRPRSVDLIAPVRAVFISADSRHALALQSPPSGSIKKGAFSVLSLDGVRAPKLVATDAPAELVALDPNDAGRALVTVSDVGARLFGSYFVRMPSLQVDFSPLSSRPISSGTVPAAHKGFIAQEHPEGRITFIDLAEGESREITGFELSAKVVNE